MKEQVITVLGVYDIDYSDEREAYIVSYKGKQLAFYYLKEDALIFIDSDVASKLFIDAPFMYSEVQQTDITKLQKILDYLAEDSIRRKYFIDKLTNTKNKQSVIDCIESNYADIFNKYDVDTFNLFIGTYKMIGRIIKY